MLLPGDFSCFSHVASPPIPHKIKSMFVAAQIHSHNHTLCMRYRSKTCLLSYEKKNPSPKQIQWMSVWASQLWWRKACYNTGWTDCAQLTCFDVFSIFFFCDDTLNISHTHVTICNLADVTGRQHSLCTHHPVIAHLFGVKHGFLPLLSSFSQQQIPPEINDSR